MNLYFYIKKLVAYRQGDQKTKKKKKNVYFYIKELVAYRLEEQKKKKNASVLLGGMDGLVAVPLDLL